MSKMRDKCDSGKWSEYEVRSKILDKHEYASRINSEYYRSHVLTSIIQERFESIKYCIRVDNMGYTQDKMTIQKNDVSMILDSRNSNNTIMMFYLKAKQYCPEVQVAHTNIT